MATLLKYKKGLKRPTLAWNEMSDDSGMYGSTIGGTDDSSMYGSIIGGTDDSGMYGSIIGGTDVARAVCPAVSLVVQI